MDIQELMNDKEFCEQIEAAESLDAVAALFSAKGVEVTAAELEAFVSSKAGELDEDALDNVAGGVSSAFVLGVAVAVVKWLYEQLKKKKK